MVWIVVVVSENIIGGRFYYAYDSEEKADEKVASLHNNGYTAFSIKLAVS